MDHKEFNNQIHKRIKVFLYRFIYSVMKLLFMKKSIRLKNQ